MQFGLNDASAPPEERIEHLDDVQQCFVLFEVGDHVCAILASDVIEILPMMTLSTQAGSPPIVVGFMNLEGTAVPVLDLQRLIENCDESIAVELYTPVIVVRHGDMQIGLIASRIQCIVWADGSELTALPDHCVAQGAVRIDDKLIPVFSADKLLLARENACLAVLQEAHQRRLEALQESSA